MEKEEREQSDRLPLADEGDWLELLVASERIPDWLDTISYGPIAMKKQALRKLQEEVKSREAYAEEARTAGAVNILTNLISQTDDEWILDVASEIIRMCSGPLAGGLQAREVVYGGHRVWIQEGALGDGLGARVWIAAHILCRRLADHPDIVSNKRILEIGSGCGLCGILAAKLGASQVTLTDYEAKVLEILRKSAQGNCGAGSTSHLQVADGTGHSQPSDDISHAVDAIKSHPAKQWDMCNMRVRMLDWSTSLATDPFKQPDSRPATPRTPVSSEVPRLDPEEKFDMLIGSDLLYEVHHGDLVASVLAERLEQDGEAYISLAIRRQVHVDRLVREAERRGFVVKQIQETVDPESVGIVGREQEYEGGFLTLVFSRS